MTRQRSNKALLRPNSLAPALAAALTLAACGDATGESTDGSGSMSESESESETSPSTTATDGPPLEPGVWDTSLEVDEDVGAFFGIWGRARDDMIAVGGQVDAGVIYRFDGTVWTPDELSFPTPRLNWVFGVDGEVFVVGYFGFALHLDADEGWVLDPTPTDHVLWGVWGASADDMWAVGGSSGSGEAPVVLHYAGDAWAEVTLPPLESEGSALFKVWGSSGDDVFAVGDRGLVVHFDGGTWNEEVSTSLASIIGVWGHPDYDVVIAGGRSAGMAGRRHPTQGWTTRRFMPHEGFDGVFMTDEGIATVVGRQGFAARFPPDSLQFVLESTPTKLELHSVFGLPDGTQFAVGGFFDSQPYVGIILERRAGQP